MLTAFTNLSTELLAPKSSARPHGRSGSIDALRCLAMTAVVAQHSGLMPFGWTGVWLFFVISGYVVTQSVIGRDRELSAPRRLRAFLDRRVRRIVPVYYAYVLVGAAVVLLLGKPLEGDAFASLLGFVNNIAQALGRGELSGWPVGHLWTISVEMQFYLVYGIVLVCASERTTRRFLVAALFVAPLARLIASDALLGLGWQPQDLAYAIYSGSLLHADSFAAGALLAFANRDGRLQRLARPLAALGIAAFVAYAVFYVGMNRLDGETGLDQLRNVVSGTLWGQYRQVVLYSVLAAAAGGLVAMAACRDPLLEWLLGRRPLQRIGEISYGAYIFHALAIWLTMQAMAPYVDLSEDRPIVISLAIFTIAYAATIVTAELSFRFYEARFLPRRAPRQLEAPLALSADRQGADEAARAA